MIIGMFLATIVGLVYIFFEFYNGKEVIKEFVESVTHKSKLDLIIRNQSLIIKNQTIIMGKFEEMQTALDSINESTNNIANDVEGLKTIIAGSGMTEANETLVLGRLQAAADALRLVAASTPEAPVVETPVGPGNPEPTV